MGSQAKGAGNYYEPVPLDFELLRRAPKEGSMLGYHTLALTVPHAVKELNKEAPPGGELASSTVSSRIRSMHVAGLVTKVRVMGSSASHGWQRTEKGQAMLDEHAQNTNGKEAPNAAADQPAEG